MPWPARGGIENQTIICPDCGNDRLGTVDGPGVRITGQFERGGTGAVLFVAWCDECPRPIHFGFKRDLIDDNADGVRRPRIQLVRD